MRLEALNLRLRDVAKAAMTFGISASPNRLESFATPKLSLENALVRSLVKARGADSVHIYLADRYASAFGFGSAFALKRK